MANIILNPIQKQNDNKVFFNVAVCGRREGKDGIGTIKPDKYGYYTIPLATLTDKSRNGYYYDIKSIVDQITDSNSIFNMMLTQGNLYGEYGHPPSDSKLDRIDKIIEKYQSHHIRKVYTQTDEDGDTVIMGEVRPTGAYGKYLEESFLNPYENTAFSLRSIVRREIDPKTKVETRYVARLVTFDHVNMQGFKKACKNYAPSIESLGVEAFESELTLDMFFDDYGNRAVGFESLSDLELCNWFGLEQIELANKTKGLHIKGTNTYLDDTGTKRSLLHSYLSKK